MERSFGLDLLRSISIWMVMLSHVAYWFDPPKDGAFVVFIKPLLLGVEPFFVLGGFLAAISFHYIQKNNDGLVHGSDAANYLRRRWVRTLPNYFLFLAIHYVAFSLTKDGFVFDFNYLIFTQNLFWLTPNFFSVSWSLATQEWFYILLPIFVYFFSKLVSAGGRLNPLVAAAIMIILISLVARLIYLSENTPENLEGELRRILLLRLDSIAIGVLIGYLYLSKQNTLYKARLNLLFCGLIGLVILCFLRRENDFAGITLVQLFFYPVFSIFLGLCLPYLYELRKTASASFSWLFENTSKWSYSLYLSHVLFLDAIYLVGTKMGIKFQGGWLVIGICVAWIFITYFASASIYKFFEIPLLKLGSVKKSGFFGNLPKKTQNGK